MMAESLENLSAPERASPVANSEADDSWETATASWLTSFRYEEEMTSISDAQRWGGLLIVPARVFSGMYVL